MSKRKVIEDTNDIKSDDQIKKKLKQDEIPVVNSETTTNLQSIINGIDIEELCSLGYDEVVSIANSIFISVKYYNNKLYMQDLIENIKFIVNTNRDLIDNQCKRDLNNPFSKQTFNQLTITDDKQGQDELLFWKVFKNKTIYKHIISFMNVTPNPLDYKYIISVMNLLLNNKIGILKDKVKSFQYLSFKDTTKTLMSMMFSKIQDDESFYQSLFTEYINQLYENDSKSEIPKKLICSNCLIGFKVFISITNYTPTIYDLKISIDDNNLVFIKFIQNHLNLDNIQIINDYNYPTYQIGLNIKNNIQLIKEYINEFNPSKEQLFKISSNWFGKNRIIDPLKIRIEDLIRIFELFELIDPINWKIHKQSDLISVNKSFDDIKSEFQTFQFQTNNKNQM